MAVRLNFELPEFFRIIWASPTAREVWEPRIQRIASAWIELERLAVVEGIKPGTLQSCSPDKLVDLSRWAAKHGLVCIPIHQQLTVDGYGNQTLAVQPGKPWEYRVFIGWPLSVGHFAGYWEKQDNKGIGRFLGFPPCCRDFFDRVWVKEGLKDTTLSMIGDSHNEINRVAGPVECNILLRWLGVRLVSHLPCSFDCAYTKKLGQELALLGRRKGFEQEMGWIEDLLSWPIKWDSLHGVATITTPCFRLVVNSTALSSKVTIEREGTTYPAEGARGNEFPFRSTQRLMFVKSEDDYTDNGFKTRKAMSDAHNIVLSAVRAAFDNEDLHDKVVDLGCGNGLLLEKIAEQYPSVRLCGVEQSGGKHQRAARRLIGHDPDLYLGNLYDDHYWNPPYGVAILSANRLLEVDEQDARTLLQRLQDGTKKVILYTYDNIPVERVSLIFECFKFVVSFSNGSSVAHLLEPRTKEDASDPVQR